MSRDDQERWITLGRVVGIHGLQGWLKIHSYTDPREKLFDYRRLVIGDETFEVIEGKAHGRGLLMRIPGIEDRTAAEPYVGKTIQFARSQLPPLAEGEYYHADLMGLRVVTEAGEDLGVVGAVASTGANDVLVVRGDRERLIPFTVGHTVSSVDLDAGRIVVDWEADWL